METSNSDANHVVFIAQKYRWVLGPMETSNSVANHAVLHAQNDRWGLGLIETLILVIMTLLWVRKKTDEGKDP